MAGKKRTAVPEDYNVYRLNPVQFICSVLAAAAIGAVVAHIFYQNMYITAAALLAGALGPRALKSMLVERRKNALNLQFKDLLYSLNSGMSAGRGLEEALITARKDVKMLYMDDSAIINMELDAMVAQINMNREVPELMMDLAERSHNEDIQSFANVLVSSKGQGINMIGLIQRTVSVLVEKLEVKQEITTKVASVKLEQRVMTVMPVLLVLMLKFMAPDYLQSLYDSPWGIPVITIVLGLIGVAIYIGAKVTDIQI